MSLNVLLSSVNKYLSEPSELKVEFSTVFLNMPARGSSTPLSAEDLKTP